MFFFAFVIVVMIALWAWFTTEPNETKSKRSSNQRPHRQPISPLPETKQLTVKSPNPQPENFKGFVPEFTDKTMAQKKGAVGEQIIKVLALNKLNPQQYRYFGNLILPNGLGGTTQIDNIIVSPFGIFVIEAKYFAGWIYGKITDNHWTHTLNRHSKYKFPNPLYQNYAHIKALMNILALRDETLFHSVVAFTHRDCQIKTDLPNNVCLLNNFVPFIQKHTQEILSNHQIETICRILSQPDWVATPERMEQHIQSLNNRYGKN